MLLSQQFCRYARSRGAVHSELASLPVNRCAAVLLNKGVCSGAECDRHCCVVKPYVQQGSEICKPVLDTPAIPILK